MTLMNNKPSITQAEEQTTMTNSSIEFKWTMEEIFAECNVSKKALILIAQMKAILVTDELRTQFMMRINYDPSGGEVNDLVYQMREEQLHLNPMSDESFMDTYLLNPVKALMQYFKEHIIPYQVERMMEWGVTIEQLVKLKQQDRNIRFERAVMKASSS